MAQSCLTALRSAVRAAPKNGRDRLAIYVGREVLERIKVELGASSSRGRAGDPAYLEGLAVHVLEELPNALPIVAPDTAIGEDPPALQGDLFD